MFKRGEVELYYEEHGAGFPILLIAPGGMRSDIPFWHRCPWNPIEQLAPRYRVIVMDQRNAGRSRAPITAADGWADYTADQLALLDRLKVGRFHAGGMCIGGSYTMALIKAAPERVVSGVLFQTIGLEKSEANRKTFMNMFDDWARELKPKRPEVSEAAWDSFRHNMYGGEFLFTVSRDFVAACKTPLLVLAGNDEYHPMESSRDVAALSPNATFIENWKEPEYNAAAKAALESFLAAHTPRAG
jgi:pimeloyl-ACP methyl ester carboxylesterase